MVDTGVEISVVTKLVAPLSKKATAIAGVAGKELMRPFCLPRKCQMGGYQVTHEFLYIPESPVSLLGRDLLSKLGAQVVFPPTKDPLFEWAKPPIYSPSREPHKMNGGCMISWKGSRMG